MVWPIMRRQNFEGAAFRLQRWIVGTGFARRFFSFGLRRLGRSNQAQDFGAFTEFIRSLGRLLLERNIFVADGTNQGRVTATIGLPEHIAAHDPPATYRNPHGGRSIRGLFRSLFRSLVRSHEPPRKTRMRRIIHWNPDLSARSNSG